MLPRMQHWRLLVQTKVREAHDWTNRRRVVQLSLIFCAGSIGYIVYNPGSGEAAITRGSIGQALIAGALGIIGTYVFGAAWDDRTRAQFYPQAREPFTPPGSPYKTSTRDPDLPHPGGDIRRGD